MRLLSVCLLVSSPLAGDVLSVRVMPPDGTELVAGQLFDARAEARCVSAGCEPSDLRLRLDGKDITARGEASRSGDLLGITVRGLSLDAGRHVLVASARAAGAATTSQASVNVRPFETGSRRKARNVILFIGDGMGLAHRTAARVAGKGTAYGRARSQLAMDGLPYNGLLQTPSLNSLVTDSAAGAHAFATGTKTNNEMLGVFPDATPEAADNPGVESLPRLLHRRLGMATGLVTTSYITDATPAAFFASTAERNEDHLVAEQLASRWREHGLRVLLGGGRRVFLPAGKDGGVRDDGKDLIAGLVRDGFTQVRTRAELKAFRAERGSKLLGLFRAWEMPSAYDKLRKGDGTAIAGTPDLPFLPEMTRAALDLLAGEPKGFFLMVEDEAIDDHAHRTDLDRTVYDVLELDQAVSVGLEFARKVNADGDPSNDTLVIVTADHETGGLSLPGVSRPDKRGTRDYLKTYEYPDPVGTNDSPILNVTDYADGDGDGYPDDADPARKLLPHFGAAPDRWEDWRAHPRPRVPALKTKKGAVPNDGDIDPKAPGAVLIPGIIEQGGSGGATRDRAVHTMVDVPVSAEGPGSSQLARVLDNTEVFFAIVHSLLGSYPVPAMP